MMMNMVHHRDNHHRPLIQSCMPNTGDGDGDGDGPAFNSSNIYDVVVDAGGFGAVAVAASDGAVGVRTLQFKSSGDMAAALGYSFTNAQLMELERQAMIYKYMVASIPVPPQLLFPITYSDPSPPYSSCGLNRRLSNGTDLEPGRCRRTDGKKWRCSRDVAPDQKYCERHMHRGRPRSRKHVELQANKKTRYSSNLSVNSTSTSGSSASQFVGAVSEAFPQTPLLTDKTSDKAPNFNDYRSLDWMIIKDSTSDRQWLHNTNIGAHTNISLLNQAPLDLNMYTDFSVSEDHHQKINNYDHHHHLFPGVESSLERGLAESPGDFIDAWSEGPNKNNSISSNGNFSLSSSLTLSMAAHNSMNDEMGQILMGLGLIESGQGQPTSWVASTPRGPLAEVLRPSIIAGNGDSSSPQATSVSSPSGVIQRTIASLSDSSGSSSPTTLTSSSRTRPEIALMWVDQEKLGSCG
ncbi:growth-regulating factor 7-like [Tripterygium wilfordii]|uniref:growth-regulating factor 7-like n=1 Tax=Tripterygium wilfordii TaxID=458696 RepID=UPI0018F7E93F|nr:growth-regulating factor 7-like [Tripterygium wilfordii]